MSELAAADSVVGTEPPLPTFVIIGAQKSATRWLRINLGRHPDVFTAPSETHFWDHGRYVRELGLQWYRSQFAGWAGEPVVGEATPGYMIWRHHPAAVARRMRAVLPDLRLIAMLRNPVDRAQSAMLHHIRRERLSPRTRLVDFIRSQPPEQEWLGIVSGGWYARSLAPYRHHFGSNLLVLLHDDVRLDPRGVYDEALLHIGATPGFVPDGLDQVVFANSNTKIVNRAQLTPEERAAAFEYFRDDVLRLEEMIGRDLSAWFPEGRPVEHPPPSRVPVVRSYVKVALWFGRLVGAADLDDRARRARIDGRPVDAFVRAAIDRNDERARMLAGDGAKEREREANVSADFWSSVQCFRVATRSAETRAGEVIAPAVALRRAMIIGGAVADLFATALALSREVGGETQAPSDVVAAAQPIVDRFGRDRAGSPGAAAAGPGERR
jgi:hypothetical protein